MANEPENLALELLRGLRAQMGELRVEMGELRAEMKADINSLRADVASDLLAMQAKATPSTRRRATRCANEFDGLRRQVFEYHSSVIGHGMLISELEVRVRRVEKHLDLPPIRAN